MTEQTNTVFTTSDYSIFEFDLSNRAIMPEKVKNLQRAARNFDPTIRNSGIIVPIIVDENMVVFDGQHRLEALKNEHLPVNFIIEKGLSSSDMISINAHASIWRISDYVSHYANTGNRYYQALIETANEYKVSVSNIARLRMITKGRSEGALLALKEGKVEFDEINLHRLMGNYKMFLDETGLPDTRSIIRSFEVLDSIKKFSLETMIVKFSKYGDSREFEHVDRFDYVFMNLAKIYNTNNGIRSKNNIEVFLAPNGKMVLKEALKEEIQTPAKVSA